MSKVKLHVFHFVCVKANSNDVLHSQDLDYAALIFITEFFIILWN